MVDDADRVLVGDRAPAHISPTFRRGGEIVDQQLDLVIVGVAVIHRGRDTVVDAAMRADADLLEPEVVVGQIVQTGKGKRDMI